LPGAWERGIIFKNFRFARWKELWKWLHSSVSTNTTEMSSTWLMWSYICKFFCNY
jgi:hypothetical protein